MIFQRIVVGLLGLVIAGLAAALYIDWKMSVQLRTVKAFVEGYVFAEAVAACENRIELGEARQEHDQCQLHARGRQRLLRLRSDQEESRHRIEFPRAGLNGIALISTGISAVAILIRNANFLNIEWLSQLTGGGSKGVI